MFAIACLERCGQIVDFCYFFDKDCKIFKDCFKHHIHWKEEGLKMIEVFDSLSVATHFSMIQPQTQ